MRHLVRMLRHRGGHHALSDRLARLILRVETDHCDLAGPARSGDRLGRSSAIRSLAANKAVTSGWACRMFLAHIEALIPLPIGGLGCDNLHSGMALQCEPESAQARIAGLMARYSLQDRDLGLRLSFSRP